MIAYIQLGKRLAHYRLNEILTYGEMSAYITQGALQECASDVFIRHFNDKDELIAYLMPYRDKDCMMLIKGSRGLQMDEVVDALCESRH